MQSNYFACQIYIKGGNKLSSLILVTESELYSITNKLQYKRIEIKNNEFNPIKQRWSNKYKTPRSNMLFEEWMKLLNIEIHKYRQSIKQVKVIKPIEPVKSIEPIKPIEPVKSIESIKPVSIIRGNTIWNEITDENDKDKQDLNQLLETIKEYIELKSNEFITKHDNKVELDITFFINGFFN